MRNLDKTTLEDILVGCAYLGTGGGGDFESGLRRVYEALDEGLSFRLMDVSELGDDEYSAVPYELGSSAPRTPEAEARYAHLPRIREPTTLASFRSLEQYIGIPFKAVIAGEIGPGNTASSLVLAARLGLPSLDADTVGRATPEINQHSVLVSGNSLVPAAAVTPFGDKIILDEVGDSSREEDIFRAIATASMGVGVTDAPIPGRLAKSPGVLVTGSLSLSERIGRAWRAALAAGDDPIAAGIEAGGGYRLFEGNIFHFDWRDEAGFLVGDVDIDGTGTYAGRSCHLDYKNEHLVARINGRIAATVPDLITLVDRETGHAINNPRFEDGQSVVVIGYRCDPIWRTAAGLKVFEPRYWGYDIDYVPIEYLQG